jgi:uncharacterized protein
MIDVLLIITALLLLIAGIIGAVIPMLPGPPLSYAGMLLMHFTSRTHFSIQFLLWMAIITIAVTLLDLILPSIATRKTGGSKKGMYGAGIGLVIGIFFLPPFGIILGPFLGAFLAELSHSKVPDTALKEALGSLLGFITGTLLKLIICFYLTWHALSWVFAG